MNFIQRFLFAWRYAQLASYDKGADDRSYWRIVDHAETVRFFNSSTGQKLRVLLNNFVFKTCYKSCAALGDHSYHAGIARGTSLAVFHLQEMITTPPKTEAQPDEEQNAALTPAYIE